MNLGLIVPGLVSGKIEMWLGFGAFFVWVLLSSLPAVAMARFLPLHKTGVKQPELQAAEA